MSQFRSLAGALVEAAAAQTRLVNSVLHQFKSPFAPTPSTTLVELLAQECNYDGYAPAALAAWNAPVLAPDSGYMIYGPQVTFVWAHVAADVGNSVGGTFLVDAAGNLIDVVIYPVAVPMSGPAQADIVTPVELFPASAV